LIEDNTIFVYLSREFFEGLLSPQYQIELGRRLQAITHAELYQLASMAARAEGYSELTANQLVEYGFLSTPVEQLHDGSTLSVVDGKFVDSRRGARGTFLPIPDVPIEQVTRTEVEDFQEIVEFHERSWPQMDPVLVGLTRTALDDQVERVKIDAHMIPLNKEKYGMLLGVFGPPNKVRIVPPADDIISVQAFLDGGGLDVPPHHLLFGIRDAAPSGDVSESKLLKSMQILRTAPAYVAAWPKPWLLERFGFHGTPTDDGMRRLFMGIYRLDSLRGFSLLSFDRDLILEVEPLLRREEVADEAQLRIHVGDVKQSKFGQWANDLDFQRAWETSSGNVRLLHLMTQQFKVPIGDVKDEVEQLLDASLFCPLGGEYQMVEEAGVSRWASSAWVQSKRQAKSIYVSPLMNWLRGLDASLIIQDDRAVAYGLLDVQRSKPEEGGINLPLFDWLEQVKPKTPTKPDPPRRPQPAELGEFEALPPPS
jgi:hypothetical protein